MWEKDIEKRENVKKECEWWLALGDARESDAKLAYPELASRPTHPHHIFMGFVSAMAK